MYSLGKNTFLMILMLQDIFSSAAIKSVTDFQVYKEVAGLSLVTQITLQYTIQRFFFSFLLPLFWDFGYKICFEHRCEI